MELIGSVAREENGTFETLKALPLYESPVPAVVVAPEYTKPFASTARPPEERVGRWKEEDMVDDAVEKKPPKPSTVEVEL